MFNTFEEPSVYEELREDIKSKESYIHFERDELFSIIEDLGLEDLKKISNAFKTIYDYM